MQYIALAVVVAVVVAVLGSVLRGWYRNAPLRRAMRTRAITFRTELSWVRFPDSPWWAGLADGEVRRMELIIRGDMFRVGAPFGLLPNLECYFRAPETTIELSRNPLRVYGVESRREWIVVSGRQEGREIQLSMTKRYFLDDVWNALISAGAVPASSGPSSPRARHEASDP